jgi:hypothetical protein
MAGGSTAIDQLAALRQFDRGAVALGAASTGERQGRSARAASANGDFQGVIGVRATGSQWRMEPDRTVGASRARHVQSRPTRQPPKPDPPDLTPAERKRVLADLAPTARRQAAALLDRYAGWDAASAATLRAYVLCCERQRALEASGGDVAELRREVRCGLALLKALRLEDGR